MKKFLRHLARRVLLLFPARRRHALVGSPRLWRLKRDIQFSILQQQGLQSKETVLDIGCGTLRGGIPIIRYLDAGKYCGVDVRADVLREGLRELEKYALQEKRPHLIAADITQVGLDRKFDIIWAFSVFIHLTDDKLEQSFVFIADHLEVGGRCLGNVNVGECPEYTWQEFPVMTRPLAFYRRQAGKVGLKVSDLGSLAKFGHNSGVEEQDEQRLLQLTLGAE